MEEFVAALGSRAPTPGGGAVGALCAAQAAALLSMVARYTLDGADLETTAQVTAILSATDDLWREALDLVAEDERAFGNVASAYRMPRSTDQEKAARRAAIQDALLIAAHPPARVVEASDRIVDQAEKLVSLGRKSLISDVGAAAEAVAAAAAIGRLNIEVNLVMMTAPDGRSSFADAVCLAGEVIDRARNVSAQVRKSIVG
jgi:formiminotetrahydrofolate cyclodeaminase